MPVCPALVPGQLPAGAGGQGGRWRPDWGPGGRGSFPSNAGGCFLTLRARPAFSSPVELTWNKPVPSASAVPAAQGGRGAQLCAGESVGVRPGCLAGVSCEQTRPGRLRGESRAAGSHSTLLLLQGLPVTPCPGGFQDGPGRPPPAGSPAAQKSLWSCSFCFISSTHLELAVRWRPYSPTSLGCCCLFGRQEVPSSDPLPPSLRRLHLGP